MSSISLIRYVLFLPFARGRSHTLPQLRQQNLGGFLCIRFFELDDLFCRNGSMFVSAFQHFIIHFDLMEKWSHEMMAYQTLEPSCHAPLNQLNNNKCPGV